MVKQNAATVDSLVIAVI